MGIQAPRLRTCFQVVGCRLLLRGVQLLLLVILAAIVQLMEVSVVMIREAQPVVVFLRLLRSNPFLMPCGGIVGPVLLIGVSRL